MMLITNSPRMSHTNTKPNVAAHHKPMGRVRTANARDIRLSPVGYLSNHHVREIKSPVARSHAEVKIATKGVPRVQTPYPFFNSSSPLVSHAGISPGPLSSVRPEIIVVSNVLEPEDEGDVLPVTLSRKVSEKKKIARNTDSEGILNLWEPTPAPATLHRLTPMYGYDVNTNLPFRILETDQVRLEPLIVSHRYPFPSPP